ncbi:MAG: carboxypeptidase-like regulatory domain-containing protein [Acidobacteriota bacterium]
MKFKVFASSAIIPLILLTFSEVGRACTYSPPYASVCEKYTNSDAIVVGTIVSAEPGGIGQLVRFRIETTYKGNLKDTVEMDQPLSTCDWDFSDKIGSKLLLYLGKNQGKTSYHAIGTGYGGSFARENDDLYWLKGLPKSLSRTRVSGTVELYDDKPFDFLNVVSAIPISISNGKHAFNVFSDKNGVYELWDVPPGKYRVIPQFEDTYKLDLTLSLGDIEFKPISKVEVDTKDFRVIIGKAKCGGSNYILNRRNE